MGVITPGSVLNSTPAAAQATLSSNYLDLATTAGQGWAQQYMPDLMEKEAEVFGQRTISGSHMTSMETQLLREMTVLELMILLL